MSARAQSDGMQIHALPGARAHPAHGSPAQLPDDASVRELMRPFARLLDDSAVTELVINRPQRILAETHLGWGAHDCVELDFERLMSFAVAVATLTSQEISANRPVLSALLPGDARIQIVIPPVVPARTVSITIRRPCMHERSLETCTREGLFEHTSWQHPARNGVPAATAADDASDAGSGPAQDLARCLASRDFAGFFALAVRSRLNIAVTGSTGSGKTSFMKTLCRYIPASERIVTIEDVRELFMPHLENCVHLIYSKGGQGQAQVTPADLIASAMRMRPDRVLLAELRGSEAYDFLKVLTASCTGRRSICSIRSPRTGARIATTRCRCFRLACCVPARYFRSHTRSTRPVATTNSGKTRRATSFWASCCCCVSGATPVSRATPTCRIIP